ncbi:hypothetical protein V8G54_017276 [Vigna mungo]|uniref:Uncharacterized protein n=1 Tax=Vigna mungo TaxID=3915 RepID=A0AAQ3NMP8_VIGMU
MKIIIVPYSTPGIADQPPGRSSRSTTHQADHPGRSSGSPGRSSGSSDRSSRPTIRVIRPTIKVDQPPDQPSGRPTTRPIIQVDHPGHQADHPGHQADQCVVEGGRPGRSDQGQWREFGQLRAERCGAGRSEVVGALMGLDGDITEGPPGGFQKDIEKTNRSDGRRQVQRVDSVSGSNTETFGAHRGVELVFPIDVNTTFRPQPLGLNHPALRPPLFGPSAPTIRPIGLNCSAHRPQPSGPLASIARPFGLNHLALQAIVNLQIKNPGRPFRRSATVDLQQIIPVGLSEGRRPWTFNERIPAGPSEGRRPWTFNERITAGLSEGRRPWIFNKIIPAGHSEGRRPWTFNERIPAGLSEGRRPWTFNERIPAGLSEGRRPWTFNKRIPASLSEAGSVARPLINKKRRLKGKSKPNHLSFPRKPPTKTYRMIDIILGLGGLMYRTVPRGSYGLLGITRPTIQADHPGRPPTRLIIQADHPGHQADHPGHPTDHPGRPFGSLGRPSRSTNHQTNHQADHPGRPTTRPIIQVDHPGHQADHPGRSSSGGGSAGPVGPRAVEGVRSDQLILRAERCGAGRSEVVGALMGLDGDITEGPPGGFQKDIEKTNRSDGRRQVQRVDSVSGSNTETFGTHRGVELVFPIVATRNQRQHNLSTSTARPQPSSPSASIIRPIGLNCSAHRPQPSGPLASIARPFGLNHLALQAIVNLQIKNLGRPFRRSATVDLQQIIPAGLSEGRRPWTFNERIPAGLSEGRRPWTFNERITADLSEGRRPWIFNKIIPAGHSEGRRPWTFNERIPAGLSEGRRPSATVDEQQRNLGWPHRRSPQHHLSRISGPRLKGKSKPNHLSFPREPPTKTHRMIDIILGLGRLMYRTASLGRPSRSTNHQADHPGRSSRSFIQADHPGRPPTRLIIQADHPGHQADHPGHPTDHPGRPFGSLGRLSRSTNHQTNHQADHPGRPTTRPIIRVTRPIIQADHPGHQADQCVVEGGRPGRSNQGQWREFGQLRAERCGAGRSEVVGALMGLDGDIMEGPPGGFQKDIEKTNRSDGRRQVQRVDSVSGSNTETIMFKTI